MKFYKVTKNGADWVMGDEITFEDPGLVSFDFTPVELTDIPEGTYIGIRAENVLIDDFTATTANVVLTRGLTIAQVTPAVDNNTIDCDENNQFTVKATVVLVKGVTPSEELKKELQEHVKKTTAPYKYPRIVEFVDELPKTISGKIKRAEIRKSDK